jgi:SNF2 family DNA or RNA helicase
MHSSSSVKSAATPLSSSFKPEEAKKAKRSAKLDYLFELLDTLFAEGRRVLLFSQFTSMLELIERELNVRRHSYLKLTGESKDRGELGQAFPKRKYSYLSHLP